MRGHIRLTSAVVAKDNKHGTGWKRVKTYKPSTVVKKHFPWIVKIARYKSKEGYLAEYNYSSRSKKWSLGAN